MSGERLNIHDKNHTETTKTAPNTIPKKSKNEPKRLFSEEQWKAMSEELALLAERNDSNGFQVKETANFNRLIANRRQLRRKKIPDYRKINVYFKSSKQYWKERNRRKQTLKMFQEGKDLGEIARTLNVCNRTVLRDMKKLQVYITGKLLEKCICWSRRDSES
jgi:Fic family protein